MRLALALPGAAALAVTVAALPGTEGDVDAVAAAREALAPSDEIVHMKVRMRMPKNDLGPTTEQWYASDPARWRSVQSFDPPRNARPQPVPVMHQMAYSNDRIRMYDDTA